MHTYVLINTRKVYELCAKSMIQGDGSEKSTSFLEVIPKAIVTSIQQLIHIDMLTTKELEKTLNENTACTDMENACEAVFKVSAFTIYAINKSVSMYVHLYPLGKGATSSRVQVR